MAHRTKIYSRPDLSESSARAISRHIVRDGDQSWKLWLYELVEEFRREPNLHLVQDPPSEELPPRLQCLLASTVEALCAENNLESPAWCAHVEPLSAPWFAMTTGTAKATVRMKCPPVFRKRNIFVPASFLARD